MLARFLLVVELLVLSTGMLVPIGRAALWRLLVGGRRHEGNRAATITTTLFLVASAAVDRILAKGTVVLPLAVTSAVWGTAQMFILLLHVKRSVMTHFHPWYGIAGVFVLVVLSMGLGLLSLLALLGKLE